MLYQELKGTVDNLGGPRVREINKVYSDLIPVRGVLIKSMNRDQLAAVNPELAAAVGSRLSFFRMATRGIPGVASRAFEGLGTATQEAAVEASLGPVSGRAAQGARSGFRYGAIAGSLAPQDSSAGR
jgi:hypothetical protein